MDFCRASLRPSAQDRGVAPIAARHMEVTAGVPEFGILGQLGLRGWSCHLGENHATEIELCSELSCRLQGFGENNSKSAKPRYTSALRNTSRIQYP